MSIEKNTPSILVKEQIYYTTIQNKVLQNIHNGFALGVYCYLSSQFEGWEVCVNQLKSHFGCGRDKIRSALNHLKEKGLYERNPVKNEKGVILQWESILRSTIHITENPSCGPSSTLLKTQSLDNPATGKSDTINNRNIKKKERYINNLSKKKYKTAIHDEDRGMEHKLEAKNEKVLMNQNKKDWGLHEPLYNNTTLKPSNLPVERTSNTSLAIEMCMYNNPFGIPVTLLNDFKEVRKIKRQPITLTAWQDITKELQLCVDNGLNPKECFAKFVSAGWARLDHKYFIAKGQYDNNDQNWLGHKEDARLL